MSNPSPESLDHLVLAHEQAEEDLRDVALLVRTAIHHLDFLVKNESFKLCEPLFSDVYRSLKLAKEKADESADWHSGEAYEAEKEAKQALDSTSTGLLPKEQASDSNG
ncbi:hypothetical protein [Acinetobacter higginsii]|uniref:hypothetical protein n=1 Tax=Acinetobacter higginsii TaxID=70347 RepID=UPI001F4B5B9E|nr:hypothetical protein [Acinetobacter higginsii]MCH7380653.1 hypothetical protein [Acinetobacter higginsii]